MDYSCTKAPSVKDKATKPDDTVFDPCRWSECRAGSCNATSAFTYDCKCPAGYSNLLNISSFPCFQSCELGMDCSNLGLFPTNNSSPSTPSAADNSKNQGAENYSSCWRLMMVALLARDIVKFINGKLLAPEEDDEDYDAGSRCSDILDSAFSERFHQKNVLRIFEVKRSMQTVTQSMNVTSSYTRLKILWDLLQEYRPQPICTCDAMTTIQEYLDEDKILLQDPLPNINKVYAAVIQEEKQRGIIILLTENSSNSNENARQFVGQFSRHGPGNRNNNSNKLVCTQCGVPGHIVAKCYKIHGYPPGYRLHGRFPKEIPNKLGNQQNRSSANFYAGSDWPESSSDDHDLASQCQRVMAMLTQRFQSQSQVQASSSHSSNPPTQTDQCQTDHNHQQPTMSIITVGMPNAVSAKVLFVETVKLHNIVLHNVLYVPNFQFNRLSVCALSDSSNYSFLFLPNKCVVQDIIKNQVIGMGERIGNLYYLS
uniref:CCHC-type domain-containing protein n=1 Tax=Cannabis sativa TaxID=3483 RepID=A0A803Q1G0_CANSA